MDILIGLALSAHMGLNGSYNEVHPHVRLETESNIVAGAYYNSMERASAYIGYEWSKEYFFVEGGAVTGYDEVSAVVPYTRAGVEFNNTKVFIAPVAEDWNGKLNYGAVVGFEFMIPIANR